MPTASDRTIQVVALDRTEDVSGVSGTGRVAYGVEFPDGTIVLRWDTEVPSTVIYQSRDDLETITGHGGRTRIVELDTIESVDGRDPDPEPILFRKEIVEHGRRKVIYSGRDEDAWPAAVLTADGDQLQLTLTVRGLQDDTPPAVQVAAIEDEVGDDPEMPRRETVNVVTLICDVCKEVIGSWSAINGMWPTVPPVWVHEHTDATYTRYVTQLPYGNVIDYTDTGAVHLPRPVVIPPRDGQAVAAQQHDRSTCLARHMVEGIGMGCDVKLVDPRTAHKGDHIDVLGNRWPNGADLLPHATAADGGLKTTHYCGRPSPSGHERCTVPVGYPGEQHPLQTTSTGLTFDHHDNTCRAYWDSTSASRVHLDHPKDPWVAEHLDLDALLTRTTTALISKHFPAALTDHKTRRRIRDIAWTAINVVLNQTSLHLPKPTTPDDDAQPGDWRAELDQALNEGRKAADWAMDAARRDIEAGLKVKEEHPPSEPDDTFSATERTREAPDSDDAQAGETAGDVWDRLMEGRKPSNVRASAYTALRRLCDSSDANAERNIASAAEGLLRLANADGYDVTVDITQQETPTGYTQSVTVSAIRPTKENENP